MTEPEKLPDVLSVLTELVRFFDDEPCKWRPDPEARRGAPLICDEHMAGKVDGQCTVVAARHLVAALEIQAQAAGIEPPLAYQVTLGQLWEALAHDQGGILAGLVLNSAGFVPERPGASIWTNERQKGVGMAQRAVAATVHDWATGS